MNIIIAIILIVGGLAAIFYIRPKIQAHVTEIKYLQTKKISELRDMFSQMDSNGVGDQYREFVELKGKIVSDNLIDTPFSNRKVAYCKSKLAQVTEEREQYRDSEGNLKTRINKHENTISEEKSSQDIYMKDDNWTIKTIDKRPSAHFEHTILVTKDGYEILTPRLDEED